MTLVVDSATVAFLPVLLVAFLIGVTALPGPLVQTSVSVSPNVRVTPEAGAALHVEPHHAVNPRNSANLVTTDWLPSLTVRFHGVWSDSRSGSYQLWSARIRVGS